MLNGKFLQVGAADVDVAALRIDLANVPPRPPLRVQLSEAEEVAEEVPP